MGEGLDEKIQEKLKKDFKEFQNYLNDVANAYFKTDIEAEIGSTPKEKVFENEIMELYSYQGDKNIPILITTPHINGYYILDLLPELSFIQFLVKSGFAPYLIRWKNLEDYKKEYDFDFYIKQGVEKSLDMIYAREKKNIILVGHCLGGVLASSYLAAFNDNRVIKYLSINSPYDFSNMGEAGKLTSPEVLDIDKLVDILGNIPSDFMNLGFQFINTGLRIKGMMAILHFYSNNSMVRIYKALLQWRDDNINMAGEFARTFIKEYFQQNLLFNDNKIILGKKASLSNITVPVLNIISSLDDIAPPLSCEGLEKKVKNSSRILLPGGHLSIIVMSMLGLDPHPYWEQIVEWIKK